MYHDYIHIGVIHYEVQACTRYTKTRIFQEQNIVFFSQVITDHLQCFWKKILVTSSCISANKTIWNLIVSTFMPHFLVNIRFFY